MSNPRPLHEFARLVRSKNAGPFVLTIDIMFDDAAAFDHVRGAGVVTAESIATLYRVPVDDVDICEHPLALAIKVSFPRPVPSGAVADTDVFGGQFHGPLVNMEIPT